jgi:hypothetical protein
MNAEVVSTVCIPGGFAQKVPGKQVTMPKSGVDSCDFVDFV